MVDVMSNGHFFIPPEVAEVVAKLQDAGHEAYIVGGCVRDLLRNAKPKDWDVTTSAKPGSEDPTLAEIEITTFRAEGKYTDKRHPDEVRFAKTLEEDLSRRDFTVNAIALDSGKSDFRIIDPFNGQSDLEQKFI